MGDENEKPAAQAIEAEESTGQPDFTRKHPLERRWTLWFDSKNRKNESNWVDSLSQVCTVSSVEEFWWCAFHSLLNAQHALLPAADVVSPKAGSPPNRSWARTSHIAALRCQPPCKQPTAIEWVVYVDVPTLFGAMHLHSPPSCRRQACTRKGRQQRQSG